MVYNRPLFKNMIDGETMFYAIERYRRDWSDAEAFWDDHKRVHWCHYGSGPCPMCPSHYSFQDCLGDLEWLITKLRKKYDIEITRNIKKNKTWTWDICMNNPPSTL